MLDFAVIGGGAAGVFGAICYGELSPNSKICVFEKSNKLLTKVKISGGGRCNATHACFDPGELIKRYPRGSKELLGAFHRWQPRDMIEWFAQKNVTIVAEPDGRMFPDTNDSQTIIDCFLDTAKVMNIELRTRCGVESIQSENGKFILKLSDGKFIEAKKVLLATGGGAENGECGLAKLLGHSITPHAPSLFTFNITDTRLDGLSGISVPNATVFFRPKHSQKGPLLITHKGLSGPAILKLSAWEARELQALKYQFTLSVNWIGNPNIASIENTLENLRKNYPKKSPFNTPIESIPTRLWERLAKAAGIPQGIIWSQVKRTEMNALTHQLMGSEFKVLGKNTNKEEFVTCGGVNLKEIDFKNFESRLCKGLYFAGEVIDIDGITGGFNFQAAWTGARLAAKSAVEN